MAFCEACGVSGIDRREMHPDPETGLFLGPCCFGKKDLTVGVELSTTRGLKAYLKYNGLVIEYKKSFKELPITNERNGFPEGMPVGEA